MASQRSSSWIVLFLPAPSPGQVIRYLERRRRSGDPVPEGLLLSDAVGPQSLRALLTPEINQTNQSWMIEAGARFSEALEGRVTYLSKIGEPRRALRLGDLAAGWFFDVWENGTQTEHGGEDYQKSYSHLDVLLTRIQGVTQRPWQWAAQRGLPLDRVPGAVRRTRPLPVLDYTMVARLDQKSLLVEDSPRLYRFALPAVPATRPPDIEKNN